MHHESIISARNNAYPGLLCRRELSLQQGIAFDAQISPITYHFLKGQWMWHNRETVGLCSELLSITSSVPLVGTSIVLSNAMNLHKLF